MYNNGSHQNLNQINISRTTKLSVQNLRKDKIEIKKKDIEGIIFLFKN